MSTALTGQGTDTGAGNDNKSSASGAGNDNQNNNAGADWRSALPEDLRSEKVFESIKGKDLNEALPVLAKNYVNAQRLVGADKVALPGEKATPEEIANFYTKLGRPAKPEDYQFQLPEGLKQEQLNGERIAAWRKRLFDLGITGKQANALMSEYIREEHGALQGMEKTRKEQQDKWLVEMKQAFGPKFDEKMNFARFALKEFGDKEGKFIAFLEETGLGNHPVMAKIFADIGEKMADPKLRGTGGGGGNNFSGAPNTPEQAQAALKAFDLDPVKQEALWKRDHPQHDAVVEERNKLFQLAFPPTSEG